MAWSFALAHLRCSQASISGTAIMNEWNSLEATKIVATILTPISVALVGWYISRQVKKLELRQWSNQKLIEKRIAVFDELAPKLNTLLCFYTWVGHWKTTRPSDVLDIKRELDSRMHVYRHLFNEAVFDSYQRYMEQLFETYTGSGSDAKIRAHIASKDGDRTRDCSYFWEEKWNANFSAANVPEKARVRAAYSHTLAMLRSTLGVN